jgi:dihydrodipicolinate synthase/N-acetylneuraminate lyase
MGLPKLKLERISEGASGLIVALANIVPGKIAQICSLAEGRELTQAISMRLELQELNDVAFQDISPIGVKYMAWKMGLITSCECRLPLVPPGPEHIEAMDDALRAAGLL